MKEAPLREAGLSDPYGRFFRLSPPTSAIHLAQPAAPEAPASQPSPGVHRGFVPQVFQDGARPLDVAQVAVLLGWTKDAVRSACERGELAHNSYIHSTTLSSSPSGGVPNPSLARSTL